MILKIWLTPPFAVARLGASETPLECYHWGPSDVRPRGTGKTTVLPGETFKVADDGAVSSYVPEAVEFKDEHGFRPVCPFFELHGRWEKDTTIHEGPLTPAVLAQFGVDASKLRWTVRVGNLKAFHMTQDPDCRIEAAVELRGDDATPAPLKGASPAGATEPLVPLGAFLPLGSARLTRPVEGFEEFRLRFTPAKGQFYGPPDLKAKWINPQTNQGVAIPDANLILNPKARWVGFRPTGADLRTAPERLYAGEGFGDSSSVGVVDDVCDGIISVTIDGLNVPAANARITVSPPDYAPDRRHLVSLADGFKDRVDRQDVVDPAYVADLDATSREILDLMERVYETMGLINVDVYSNRVDIQENPSIASDRGIPSKPTDHLAFPPPSPGSPVKFPSTERGRQFHRRFTSITLFRDMIRENPDLIEDWVRKPFDPDPFFTRKMPPVMRDSWGGPLHLTRRQYDILVAWAAKIREGVEEGS